MSEAITSVVKLAINFVRSYSAEKLQDGGLTDQKFRSWIVRELDDIKFKLDGLSRKDLFSSISCLQQGVDRLSMCFDESSESGNSSETKCDIQKTRKNSQDKTSVGATASAQTKPAKTSVEIDDAVALVSAIGELKIVSNKRFESAMESFKEAGKEARRAFHNTALNTEERILASKVRIASGILEYLDDPEFAANDCLRYLQELHDLPAIQDIFSVHIKAGIKSWIKSGFKKDSRIVDVENVTMINLSLADFISKFTKRRMGALDWPMIMCGKRVVHPMHYEKDSLPNLKELEITPPSWEMVKSTDCRFVKDGECAFNKKGDGKTMGKLTPYCVSPSQVKHTKDVVCQAVDDEDTVYVLSHEGYCKYTLSVYNENGVNTHHCTLKFIVQWIPYRYNGICVTKDKNIVICALNCNYGYECGVIQVWLCDSNGELRNSFIDKSNIDTGCLKCVVATCNNEIRVVSEELHFWSTNDFVLRIYTEYGHLQRSVRYRPNGSVTYHSLCYNKVTTNIIGCVDLIDRILVEFWSDQTAELLRSYLLYKTNLPVDLYCPDDVRKFSRVNRDVGMVCHANGTLALVDKYGNALFLAVKTCS